MCVGGLVKDCLERENSLKARWSPQSMFGGAYGDARMQIGPTDTAPPCLRSPQRACVVTKEERPFCPISLLLLKCADGATTLSLHFGISGLGGELAAGCLQNRLAWIVFCFCCWVADGKNGGMPRSGIGCWGAVAMGRSSAISILRRIVRATKAATCSHPSALFSIIGTKLSGVRGGSLIFSRAVIAS